MRSRHVFYLFAHLTLAHLIPVRDGHDTLETDSTAWFRESKISTSSVSTSYVARQSPATPSSSSQSMRTSYTTSTVSKRDSRYTILPHPYPFPYRIPKNSTLSPHPTGSAPVPRPTCIYPHESSLPFPGPKGCPVLRCDPARIETTTKTISTTLTTTKTTTVERSTASVSRCSITSCPLVSTQTLVLPAGAVTSVVTTQVTVLKTVTETKTIAAGPTLSSSSRTSLDPGKP